MRKLAPLLLAFTSCSNEPTVVVPDLPDSASYGVLVQTRVGRLIEASPLIRIEPGQKISASLTDLRSGDVLRFHAFDASAIEPLLPADRSGLSVRITVRDANQPQMPEPSWAGEGTHEGGATTRLETTSAPGPDLTAAWLPGCARVGLDDYYKVDVTCSRQFCDPRVEQIRCELFVDLPACLISDNALEGEVDSAGDIRFSPLASEDASYACEKLPATDGATLAIGCTGGLAGCQIRAYSEPAPPPIAARGVDLVPNAEWEVPDFRYKQSGYLVAGLVALDDAIAVPVRALTSIQGCDPNGSDDLVFIDPQSVEVVRTATVPPCMVGFTRDPASAGFIGLYQIPEHAFARFSETGALLEWSPLRSPNARPAAHPAVLRAADDPPRVFVGYQEARPPDTPIPSLIEGYGAVDFTLQFATETDDAEVRFIEPVGDHLVAFEEIHNAIYLINPANGRIEDQTFVRTAGSFEKKNVSWLGFHPRSSRMLLGHVHNSQPALFGYDVVLPPALPRFGDFRPGVTAFEFAADPSAIHPWPSDPDLAIVAVVAQTAERNASALLFDVVGGYYRPGSTEIGIGPAFHPTGDAQGRIWMVLPWAGRVVRLEPAESPGG